MKIDRKIACIYLRNQYDRAKKYLIKEINANKSNEELNTICELVRRAGIAYAQAQYCNFLNDENGNKVTISPQYQEVIDSMEKYIGHILLVARVEAAVETAIKEYHQKKINDLLF